ncbi:hypothetical protein ASF24_03530 [Methylobacterium sp. Leaf86]|uniref:hypothetical protein n=1 Tax=Methylobacterium sp. Leaf86 TaxID=1736242 RepID=UPI0006F64409|nr:hypothetical protein [Methylobacterium sp. Leaf86]KQO61022.1 hypothetical protein ASF24_03530 [Methylobacterium sp. Leaf86]
MSEDDQRNSAEIIPLFGQQNETKRPSIVERASLAEVGRRDELSKILEPRLTSSVQMKWEDRFVLARNLRDLLDGLESVGKINIKELGDQVFGRRAAKVFQEYKLPKGLKDLAEFRARYPTRPLAGKPRRYHEIAVKAAKTAGVSERQAVIDLARGSSFWPGAEDVGDQERRAANEVAEVLRLMRHPLDEIYSLDRYFDAVERYRIVPRKGPDGLVFRQDQEFGWWVQDAFPTVPLATRWLQPVQNPVVVVSEQEGGKRLFDYEFDQLYGSRRFFESSVSRRQSFALGMGRLADGIGPVGVIGHEILLASSGGFTVKHQAKVDRIGPGWNRVDIEVDGRVLQGAWQLMEALLDPPQEEDGYMDGDEPPDVVIVPITADWLLGSRERGWMITRSVEPGALWPILVNGHDSRLGHEDTVPAIIERCLLADGEKWGPVKQLRTCYSEQSAALVTWVTEIDTTNRNRLEGMIARLTSSATKATSTAAREGET